MTIVKDYSGIEDFLKFLGKFELYVVDGDAMTENLAPEPLSHKKLMSAYFRFRKLESNADNRRKVYAWFND